MRINCPTCQTPVDLGDSSAGTLIRCRACGRSFVAPQELAVTGRPHTLTAFSLPGLVLLHFVTVGLFPIVHLNLMHDRLPRIRRSDPSGFVAVALSFIPGVNLIWFFFTFRRLCVRINEQRVFAGLPQTAPQSLALIVPTLLCCGFAATIWPLAGWVVLGATVWVLMPVFLAVLQASVNELVAVRRDHLVGQGHDERQPGADPGDRHRDLRPPRERGSLAGAAGAGDGRP